MLGSLERSRPQCVGAALAAAVADQLAAAAATGASDSDDQHPTCLLMENRNKSQSSFRRYQLTKR